MATHSLHPEVQESATPAQAPKPSFWKDEQWAERTEVPSRARDLLRRIDQNIYVCMNLALLLADNDNAVAFASGDAGSPIRALPFDQRAAVVLAMTEILSESSDLTDDLRNDAKPWGEGA